MGVEQRNNVRVGGAGTDTVIFGHGFGCDLNMWRLLEPVYAKRYRTVLFDHVGAGASDLTAYVPSRYSSLKGYADDLVEIAQEFGEGRLIFVGHSVGATIGMLADLAAPNIFAAHAMIGPSPCYVDDDGYIGGFSREDIDELLKTLEGNYLGWSSNMAPAIMGAPEQPELGVELVNSFCRTDPDIAARFARATFLSDHRADLPRLRAPTLILQCDDDIIAPVAVGEYMAKTLPDAELVVIENVGHCPQLSSPGPSADAIDAFLSRRGL
ncbi:alpha/beta fold hydrolase [Variovorax sp. GB1R11]|uniref:alpha/beta fold hydrolase n=1 Tax=Variovorax sp. GB1R11 TaxID=3443741 RepID=UPI003F48CFC9